MYGPDSAAIYDAQHELRGKDYRGEAHVVLDLIRARRPEAASLLDVACGTGGHLRHFAESLECEGVELSMPMLERARTALPSLRLHEGDMRTLDLGRRFDAITCLFASIGYVETAEQVTQTLRCFADHLEPGGVVVVEPWWTSDRFLDGYVSGDVVRQGDRLLSRLTHTVREGTHSVMRVQYGIADSDTGLQQFGEEHRALLLDREQYEAAFLEAGLEVEYVPDVACGRGLFVGQAAA